MCGRFVLTTPAQVIAEAFGVDVSGEMAPRYNIAPGQRVAVVRESEPGRREFATMRWGLVPSWSKELPRSVAMINARSDTAPEKPAFRRAFRQRRCLVPASGFYEWTPAPADPGAAGRPTRKQPWLLSLHGGEPFAIAGLWERWRPAGGEPLESCTLLTCEPNELVRPIHDRMPVILPRERWSRWLDPSVRDVAALQPLLVPLDPGEMTARPVSTWVNDPRHEDPRCILPP